MTVPALGRAEAHKRARLGLAPKCNVAANLSACVMDPEGKRERERRRERERERGRGRERGRKK